MKMDVITHLHSLRTLRTVLRLQLILGLMALIPLQIVQNEQMPSLFVVLKNNRYYCRTKANLPQW